MSKSELVKILDEAGLHLLSTGIRNADLYEYEILTDIVKSSTGIDLSSSDTLSAIELEELKTFEDVNKNLIASVAITKTARGFWDVVDHLIEATSFKMVFGMAMSVFSCCYITFVTIFDIPAENRRYVDTVLGFVMGTILGTVVSYFLGSSDAETSKQETTNTNTEITKQETEHKQK